MSRLVQTGSTARANTRNKCYWGLSSKQVESSAIRRHIWWILLQLGDNFFLGSQGRTKVWKKKKAAIPLIQLSPQMKQWPVQVSARLVFTVVGTIIFTPSALVDIQRITNSNTTLATYTTAPFTTTRASSLSLLSTLSHVLFSGFFSLGKRLTNIWRQ